jgi:hypothetical protein
MESEDRSKQQSGQTPSFKFVSSTDIYIQVLSSFLHLWDRSKVHQEFVSYYKERVKQEAFNKEPLLFLRDLCQVQSSTNGIPDYAKIVKRIVDIRAQAKQPATAPLELPELAIEDFLHYLKFAFQSERWICFTDRDEPQKKPPIMPKEFNKKLVELKKAIEDGGSLDPVNQFINDYPASWVHQMYSTFFEDDNVKAKNLEDCNIIKALEHFSSYFFTFRMACTLISHSPYDEDSRSYTNFLGFVNNFIWTEDYDNDIKGQLSQNNDFANFCRAQFFSKMKYFTDEKKMEKFSSFIDLMQNFLQKDTTSSAKVLKQVVFKRFHLMGSKMSLSMIRGRPEVIRESGSQAAHYSDFEEARAVPGMQVYPIALTVIRSFTVRDSFGNINYSIRDTTVEELIRNIEPQIKCYRDLVLDYHHMLLVIDTVIGTQTMRCINQDRQLSDVYKFTTLNSKIQILRVKDKGIALRDKIALINPTDPSSEDHNQPWVVNCFDDNFTMKDYLEFLRKEVLPDTPKSKTAQEFEKELIFFPSFAALSNTAYKERCEAIMAGLAKKSGCFEKILLRDIIKEFNEIIQKIVNGPRFRNLEAREHAYQPAKDCGKKGTGNIYEAGAVRLLCKFKPSVSSTSSYASKLKLMPKSINVEMRSNMTNFLEYVMLSDSNLNHLWSPEVEKERRNERFTEKDGLQLSKARSFSDQDQRMVISCDR